MINSRNPYDLLPVVREMYFQHLKELLEQKIEVLLTSTYRDNESQLALYNQGRTMPGVTVTDAKPGDSFHNWRCAYDIYPLINGKLRGTSSADLKVWEQVGA